jgi:hypothetical protein
MPAVSRPDRALLDPDLVLLERAWPTLSPGVREAILVLVRASKGQA